MTVGGALSVNVSPNPGGGALANGAPYSQGFTATASGGSGGYSYLWTFVANDGFSFSGSTTSASATVTHASGTDVLHDCIIRCTVTDGGSQTDTADAGISVTWGTPP